MPPRRRVAEAMPTRERVAYERACSRNAMRFAVEEYLYVVVAAPRTMMRTFTNAYASSVAQFMICCRASCSLTFVMHTRALFMAFYRASGKVRVDECS